MKRRVRLIGMLGAVGVVAALGATWGAQKAVSSQMSMEPCVYYYGSCITMAALTGGNFRMLP
ncbi:hypothetical protein B0G76_5580 [Paraburkholderia sp. BL23I1N1]|uniref:hypothetical protein n=1 Tax=Paraburkholderia sp. BL23I1N1 TaxID=1938802 RepID=UPI000FEEA53A|nr:hypothetical protein [Paraburkholderia sp. BL23I1N1]RKE39184.1 hypothetical protein B0G76_5580 [Paraburkholderia sp. BL23I1N1]